MSHLSEVHILFDYSFSYLNNSFIRVRHKEWLLCRGLKYHSCCIFRIIFLKCNNNTQPNLFSIPSVLESIYFEKVNTCQESVGIQLYWFRCHNISTFNNKLKFFFSTVLDLYQHDIYFVRAADTRQRIENFPFVEGIVS